jgi:hypothetical protein
MLDLGPDRRAGLGGVRISSTLPGLGYLLHRLGWEDEAGQGPQLGRRGSTPIVTVSGGGSGTVMIAGSDRHQARPSAAADLPDPAAPGT